MREICEAIKRLFSYISDTLKKGGQSMSKLYDYLSRRPEITAGRFVYCDQEDPGRIDFETRNRSELLRWAADHTRYDELYKTDRDGDRTLDENGHAVVAVYDGILAERLQRLRESMRNALTP